VDKAKQNKKAQKPQKKPTTSKTTKDKNGATTLRKFPIKCLGHKVHKVVNTKIFFDVFS